MRWLALLALGALLLTNTAFRRRQIVRELSEQVEGSDRFVDIGVILRTVVSDPAGSVLLEGKPPMRVVAERRLGGIVDTKAAQPSIVGPSKSPRIWYASEEQTAIVLHDDPAKLGQLVYGSEGAGKTRALAMWHYVQWLRHLGERREGGQTAPTSTRLEFVRREMFELFAPNWYRYAVADERMTLCDGTRIQLVSTYRQSKAQGSPIQGFNWSWCGRDEAQDQIEVHEDIESRGRSSKDGRYRQLATATAKDDSDWRTLRDRLLASGQWERRQLSIFQSPFVAPEFIEAKKATMTEREYRRRYGAEDLPPERAVYPAWDRKHNLIRVDPAWSDVTERELSRWGANYRALVGHDPGSLFDVSLVLRAYERRRGLPPMWVVVDEVTTEQTTTEQHVAALLERVKDKWLLNQRGRDGTIGPRMLVRADPYGNNDSKPDRSCYTIFRNAGITVHPAAYNDDGSGPGRVPKNEGIEVVNTLLCSASGDRRLFIALDEHHKPVAPNLVRAIESSERDQDGKAETQKKNKHDQSHWPAALRYALWAIERPRLGGRV